MAIQRFGRRQAIPDDEPAAKMRGIGLEPAGNARIETHHAKGADVAVKHLHERGPEPPQIALHLGFEQHRCAAPDQREQLREGRDRVSADRKVRPSSATVERPMMAGSPHMRCASESWKTRSWSSAVRRRSHSIPAPTSSAAANAVRLFSTIAGARCSPRWAKPFRPGSKRISRGSGRSHRPRRRPRAGGRGRRPRSGHGGRPRRTRPASVPTRHWRPWAGR